MYKITINLGVQVEKGPQFNFSPPITIEVEAYDPLEAIIEPGKSKTIQVQPGNQVSFLLIKSSVYTPSNAADSKWLTYTTGQAKDINLERPQIYLGKASIAKLLGDVQKITFSNNLEGEAAKEPAVIEILVGRNATAPANGT